MAGRGKKNVEMRTWIKSIRETLQRDRSLPRSLLRALNLELEFQKLRIERERERKAPSRISHECTDHASRLLPFQLRFPSFYLHLRLYLPLPLPLPLPPWTQTPDNVPKDLYGLPSLRRH